MVQYIYHNKKLSETRSDVSRRKIFLNILFLMRTSSVLSGPVRLSAHVPNTRTAKVVMLNGVVTGMHCWFISCEYIVNI